MTEAKQPKYEIIPKDFNGNEIDFISKEEDIWITAETLGIGLEYNDPRINIMRLFHRHKDEIEEYSSVIELTTEAGMRKTTVEVGEVFNGSPITLRKYRISEEGLKKLNERQRKVIEHLKVYKRISRSEYAKLTDCSERTAFRDLGELMKNKIVIRKGKSKKTYYELA